VMTRRDAALKVFGAFVVLAFAMLSVCISGGGAKKPVDPGVRGGAAGAGNPLSNLTADEKTFFQDGFTRFIELEVVQGGSNNGLGPRFNSNQCFACHSQPAAGGSSPAQNPLIAVAKLNGAKNVVPWFIAPNGPVREARFKRNPDGTNDGGVHDLFVITGRSDAKGCNISQPNFLPAGNPLTGRAEIQTSSFASPPRSLGPDSLKQFPTRRFSPICTPTRPRRHSWAFTVTPTLT
jgi:hypothetical protein